MMIIERQSGNYVPELGTNLFIEANGSVPAVW